MAYFVGVLPIKLRFKYGIGKNNEHLMRTCYTNSIKEFINVEEKIWLEKMINNFKLIFSGEIPSLKENIVFEYLFPWKGEEDQM